MNDSTSKSPSGSIAYANSYRKSNDASTRTTTMGDTTVFWMLDRLVMQGIFLLFLVSILILVWRNASNNKSMADTIADLLMQGQEDARVRNEQADKLDQRTREMEERTAKALAEHNEIVLSKLDETKQTAEAAAQESRNYAEVANSLNEKIKDTNARLLENAQIKVITQQVKDTESIHEHINKVDEKVATLVEKEK